MFLNLNEKIVETEKEFPLAEVVVFFIVFVGQRIKRNLSFRLSPLQTQMMRFRRQSVTAAQRATISTVTAAVNEQVKGLQLLRKIRH